MTDQTLESLSILISNLAIKTPAEQKHLLELFNHFIHDNKAKQIASQIMNIKGDTFFLPHTRENKLSRIDRFVKSASRNTQKNKDGSLFPTTRPFSIICVNFAGIGSEHDEYHYAIVWTEQRSRDNITVIPTTSFKADRTLETEGSFNIGKVAFLQDETVVLLEQLTTISRKRIQKIKHLNPLTNNLEIVTLSKTQQERIKDGFRIIGLKEKSLYKEFIEKSFQDTLPVFSNHSLQYTHLNRPIKVIKNTKETLSYSLYESEEVFTMNRKPYILSKSLTRSILLEKWKKAVAKKNEKTNHIIATRKQAQENAYQEIQNAIKLYTDQIEKSNSSNQENQP
ncbi:type II toxin-antitoxin system PemK/MazF family toxin [Paenibacillus campi]|uniref:type II toxin-antitoxin system PemK/MazF family toxin n=1 Tax=Paenibacillus campi TaxID=3106031 RepID=UPI002AFE699C|nr:MULTISPECIES: type II toxin-antitoxin system PemK/MazF family toxin [unclassified Paenibacillus]